MLHALLPEADPTALKLLAELGGREHATQITGTAEDARVSLRMPVRDIVLRDE